MKHRVDQRIQEASLAEPENEHLKINVLKFIRLKFLHYTVLFKINSTTLRCFRY